MIAGAFRHTVKAVTLGALLAGAVPAVAAADVRYAEPDGDGPEPCLSGDPCDIQIAVEGTVPADVVDGDEVVLLPGSYLLGTSDVEITDDIHVHGYDLERSVAPGAPARFVFPADIEGVFEIESHEAEHHGQDALIARLVVDRKTNTQIAAELFLSSKTVESHLRNTFRKLGVASRVEVARVVERADRAP